MDSQVDAATGELAALRLNNNVKLNVGGRIYKTTLHTLCKDPNSMLAAMFSGRFGKTTDERDGAYFIDRDGELFRYILNYLRNGQLICPMDPATRSELLAEADFFQLQGLIDELRGTPNIRPSSSIITNPQDEDILNFWLPSNARFSLLYQGSSHLNCAKDFHSCCDDKGPSLVLIKNGPRILGGYTEVPWKSPITMMAFPDRYAFLFSLTNSIATKFESSIDSRGHRGGIRCVENYGPCFGTCSSYDLQILVGIDNKWFGRADLGQSYNFPFPSKEKANFIESSPFVIDKLEVYAVS